MKKAPTPTVEEKAAFDAADEFKRLVMTRIGVTKWTELQCPREKSHMTPCIARDGWIALAFTSGTSDLTHAICVGCEAFLTQVLRDERERWTRS